LPAEVVALLVMVIVVTADVLVGGATSAPLSLSKPRRAPTKLESEIADTSPSWESWDWPRGPVCKQTNYVH